MANTPVQNTIGACRLAALVVKVAKEHPHGADGPRAVKRACMEVSMSEVIGALYMLAKTADITPDEILSGMASWIVEQ